MMNEETKAALNEFLKKREEYIKNMTLAEARDTVSRIYGHSDMRMESDKALQMLLDCADKALEQGDVLDKIRAEIEETYINIAYQENKDRQASWGLRKALQIIDKYKAESEKEGKVLYG